MRRADALAALERHADDPDPDTRVVITNAIRLLRERSRTD